MFAQSAHLDTATTEAPLNLGQVALLIIVGFLLAFASLAQVFPLVSGYDGFIRAAELLFVGVFLLHTARSYKTPSLKPALAGWLFLAWLIAASASVVLADQFDAALTRHAAWLVHLLFAFALWHVLRRDALTLKAILWLIPLGFFMTALFMVATWVSVSDPRAYDWFASPPLFWHIRHFGYYALAGLVFSAFPLLGFGKKVSRQTLILALLTLSACWAFLFWTGGRAAIGSAALALAVMLWFADRDQRVWTIGVCVLAAGLGLWLSTLFWVESPWMGFFNSFERTTAATTAEGVQGLTSGRLAMWTEVLRVWQEQPWLGLGPDAYAHLPNRPFGVQPHSMLVQFLLEWGLLGALPFLGLLLAALVKGYHAIRHETSALHKTARVTAFAFILGASVHSLVDGLYYHAQPLLFLATCFAIILLPVQTARFWTVRHPVFRHLAAYRTMLVATLLLIVFFVLKSSAVNLLILRIWGG